MTYGHDPHRGVEQFHNEIPPKNKTAPVTYWLRDQTGMDFVDVAMPEGHVVRAISRDLAEDYETRGGKVLPINV